MERRIECDRSSLEAEFVDGHLLKLVTKSGATSYHKCDKGRFSNLVTELDNSELSSWHFDNENFSVSIGCVESIELLETMACATAYGCCALSKLVFG